MNLIFRQQSSSQRLRSPSQDPGSPGLDRRGRDGLEDRHHRRQRSAGKRNQRSDQVILNIIYTSYFVVMLSTNWKLFR